MKISGIAGFSMTSEKRLLNEEVTEFLDALNHPLRNEIEALRRIILSANADLIENIKWNAPNYRFGGDDRITMKIRPPKQVQIIFHRGAKPVAQPAERLIEDGSKLLAWKTNDRAVAAFSDMTEIAANEAKLAGIVKDWLNAAS